MDINPHNQALVRKTTEQGNHRFARRWVLECRDCGHRYGANSCDFHIRKCPECQNGKRGLSAEAA